MPENVFGSVPYHGWQADKQLTGAWIQINFAGPTLVSELWVQGRAASPDVLGQDVYLMTHSRSGSLTQPRRVRLEFSKGSSHEVQLTEAPYFQIVVLPEVRETTFMRIVVEDVWPAEGATDAGIGKVRVFTLRHSMGFDILPYSTYSAEEGKPIQAASLRVINPNDALAGAVLTISRSGAPVATIPVPSTPARAVFEHSIWIPAPFEDSEFEFALTTPSTRTDTRTLAIRKYRSYFDGGTFQFNCTNHNDLGWLDTQAKTADYRSSALIIPAIEQMQRYPEFEYTMECSAYLMEFLDRHPEKRDEIAGLMRSRRFVWGASYVELLQVSAGPEKLVRQFYLGRRWLRNTFPGVDSTLYIQTDPPSMSLQMPQILARAGVKYCLLGRLPFGFYNWVSPDGSNVLTYGYRYVDALTLIDLKNNSGWLDAAAEREEYYRRHHCPHNFLYDYTSDYLPPQPDLVPYIRGQNSDMEHFKDAWNAHFQGQPDEQIHPPRLSVTTPDKFLKSLRQQAIDIPTLRGDWPLAWAYYDEPSNREALLAGRIAHNDLLAAERLYVSLGLKPGFHDYPSPEFADAWRANVWPDHGWGGNHGLITDKVYADSYLKSKTMAQRLVSEAGAKLASRIAHDSSSGILLLVFNQLSWPRTDLVELEFEPPAGLQSWSLNDDSGAKVPCEQESSGPDSNKQRVTFVAHDVPAVGYRTYSIRPNSGNRSKALQLKDHLIENEHFRVEFGRGGIKSLFDKHLAWEVLRTDKFDGAEVLQFSAPGNAWEDVEQVTLDHFDRTANHDFQLVSATKSEIRTTAVYQADFDEFRLRQQFHVYDAIPRVDIETEIQDWKGTPERELRVAFPMNLNEARMSYEVPFGTVEMGKDELDFSLLPSALDSQFSQTNYGGSHPLTFREAINWIDASSSQFGENGCLLASDVTVHLFEDESANPVQYPMLQHVLLSTRKSLAWNPEYWYTQQGNHRYRMSILPHGGDWRERYREAIAFNYRLAAFMPVDGTSKVTSNLPGTQSFLTLEPHNLVMTAMKKCEDDDWVIVRFYEAEGNISTARIRLARPIVSAYRTNLIEEAADRIDVMADGSIELPVGPWEIVTIRLRV